ncbi:hypothetical protein [Hymenobacter metallicola]|uniref:Uncharacterized protein n=1 Tax=Hymenobacter metallicola TaxID=2563114 RepID=A0A4Z0QJZ6_9BACT|nr:hypothetical protein [Hymenobacter metallicola]TGE29826.1 hypothetical protein E5K02_10305 [Hymenobacter metallicola]
MEENRILLAATVFPSQEQTIVALPTDEKFQGAHNYEIHPMMRFENGAAVYGEGTHAITFVKRNEDGTWQPGVQTEQLLLLLKDRHNKLNNVFPSEDHDEFIAGIDKALAALERRVRERQGRGVMGELKK